MLRNLLFYLSLLSPLWLTAQLREPREEDQFWKKRVIVRLNLNDKINRCLKQRETEAPLDLRYTETDGIVLALLRGLQKGDYQAYDHVSWKPLNYKQVNNRMKYMERAWNKCLSYSEQQPLDAWAEVQFEDEETESEGFASAADFFPTEEGTFTADMVKRAAERIRPSTDMTPYEHTLVIVEDWIFDKNSSRMLYLPRYIQLMWVDPTGMMPDKAVATFEYKDVVDLLDKTLCKNRFNDGGLLSARQVIDAHLYNGVLVNVSGKQISTYDEAQKRFQEIVEFESYLWSN